MIDILTAIAVALALFGIIGMVLVPAPPTRSSRQQVVRRDPLGQWLGKYLRLQVRLQVGSKSGPK
jgi:hypothetical protein